MFRSNLTLDCGCKTIKYFRNYCFATKSTNRQILSDLMGITREEATMYLEKQKLFNKDSELLVQSIRFCQSLGYPNGDILVTPRLLSTHPVELEQHYYALQEGGFHNITPDVLAKARTYMSRIITYLKSKHLIPSSTNVPETLISYIEDKEIAQQISNDYEDGDLWKNIHLKILKNFLRLRLGCSQEEIDNLIKVHQFLKNKSFKVIQRNIKSAEQLGFEPRTILKCGYLLGHCPTYSETTLRDLDNIAGVNMKQAMRRYPKLVVTSPKNIIKIYGILKEFGISDECIQNKPNVFHMSPETVKLRLQELSKSPELKILLSHPKCLALVVHHNRARTRLSFLQQCQLRCTSLTILKTDVNDDFEEYVKEGKDINKKSDVLHYLQRLFLLDIKEIRSKIRRHPHYLQVPLNDMQSTYDYLIAKRFSSSNIYKVIYILLYPVEKVRNAHATIKYDVSFKYKTISQLDKLNLILYLMEKEHHFTGNGIWKNDRIPEYVENVNL